ncbi:MAG: nucleotidyltransferase family protein [Eubacterium sp.]
MNNEEKLLIEICKCYMNSESIFLPDNINYPALFRLSKAHNLAPICHCAFTNAKNAEIIPNNCIDDFKNNFLDCIYLCECQSVCIDDIKSLFSDNEIPHIFFKGAVLRNLYPVPQSRPMGDIDLLIKPEYRDRVKKILTEAGFECTAQNGPVFDYRRNNVLVEVHTRLISEFGEKAFSDPFSHAVFDGYSGKLEENYHFAYLIAHTAHHFKFYGAGIRHILDMAVFQKNADIDINKALEFLADINLDRFAKTVLSVCRKWFCVGRAFTEDTEKTESFLCKRGAFGGMNKNKGAVLTRKELERGKEKSSLKMKLSLAFPPYSRLKEIPYIKFIDGRPWLTPYAWCYRFYFNLKNRRDFMKDAVNSLDDENTLSLAKEELKFFEEIGLI